MIGILIIAHGNFGESLLSCAKHVLGSAPPQCATLAVSSHDDHQTLLPKAQALIAQVNTGDGVLVLTDMYGATPCNIIRQVLQTGAVEGVAGVNLPMLLRSITYRHVSLSSLVEKAVSGGREGVVHFNQANCDHYKSVD
jgi:PTS system mannose-specific IIA component